MLETKVNLPADAKLKIMTDGGSENLIISKGTVLRAVAEHVVAQTATHFLNSMIEAFWKQLKYQWLYVHHLDTITTLRRLIAVEPDLATRLATAHTDDRRARIEANLAIQCASCVPITDHLRSVP